MMQDQFQLIQVASESDLPVVFGEYDVKLKNGKFTRQWYLKENRHSWLNKVAYYYCPVEYTPQYLDKVYREMCKKHNLIYLNGHNLPLSNQMPKL